MKVDKFGKGAAGASITQIATWSNILLRNKIMDNEAFNIQMTPQTTYIHNHKSISERNSSEYKQQSRNREMHLHRTRQLYNKSHCVIPAPSRYDELSNKEDTEEEVCYSEGEPFDDPLYPNNTWNSDDSAHEED